MQNKIILPFSLAPLRTSTTPVLPFSCSLRAACFRKIDVFFMLTLAKFEREGGLELPRFRLNFILWYASSSNASMYYVCQVWMQSILQWHGTISLLWSHYYYNTFLLINANSIAHPNAHLPSCCNKQSERPVCAQPGCTWLGRDYGRRLLEHLERCSLFRTIREVIWFSSPSPVINLFVCYSYQLWNKRLFVTVINGTLTAAELLLTLLIHT